MSPRSWSVTPGVTKVSCSTRPLPGGQIGAERSHMDARRIRGDTKGTRRVSPRGAMGSHAVPIGIMGVSMAIQWGQGAHGNPVGIPWGYMVAIIPMGIHGGPMGTPPGAVSAGMIGYVTVILAHLLAVFSLRPTCAYELGGRVGMGGSHFNVRCGNLTTTPPPIPQRPPPYTTPHPIPPPYPPPHPSARVL